MTINRMIELLEAEVKRQHALAMESNEHSLFHAHMEVSEALMMAIGIARGRLR